MMDDQQIIDNPLIIIGKIQFCTNCLLSVCPSLSSILVSL